MGGGYYHSDVRSARSAVSTTRSSEAAFSHHKEAEAGRVNTVHPSLDPKGGIRECRDSAEHPESTPVVVGLDVTSSRGDDTKRIYEQVPSMLGSLMTTGIVPDPMILFGAIGDAHNPDKAPIQLGQFESDRRMDEQLANIWMEGGGGGTGEESYELFAYYLAYRTELDCLSRGKKGFVFFTGDEAPYDTVQKTQVKQHLGITIPRNLKSKTVFKALQEKYHPFLIFPRKPMEDRKADIDTEIRRRLEEAGGRFADVDIRASLIWENRNDLDLHCITPDGDHIYYGRKKDRCGGELDVDRNVQGETPKPVENIRWARGDAPKGHYRFFVENYGYHSDPSRSSYPFKVELDIDGEIQTIEGRVPANVTGAESRQEVFAFDFTPGTKAAEAEKNRFADYEDDVILGKWEKLIPSAHILRVQDPSDSVEVMLGVMALQSGKMDLHGFIDDMKHRNVQRKRIADVKSALQTFAEQGVFHQVDAGAFS